MTSRIYKLLRELKCATALEIAEKLGITRKSAQTYLNRLVARGAVEKRTLGKRAVIYCAKDGPGGGPRGGSRSAVRKREEGGAYRLCTATRRRLTHVLEMLMRDGCVSVGTLARVLNVTHTKAYHMLRVMLLLRRGVRVKIGKTAVLCRDHEAAEEAISRIRDAVHRLVVANGMKYATALKILRAALEDGNAYALLSRFIPLRRGMKKFPPLVLTFINAVLETLYGEPLRYGNRRIYVVSHPRAEYHIEIVDSIDRHAVAVNLPSDLAATLSGADVNEIVLQALEQLLQRYRS